MRHCLSAALALAATLPAAAPAAAQGTMTPAEAARAGATYIVVGRPILQAADPAAAARAILAELATT